ncbi:MAG: D-alanine--D-alanine ligase [Anaerolineae bacterium]|jgi:D-alanine-D-alanine ligase|nr:D-alanine--D-alanine ligase [Anaerolineae bacterium]MBT7599504.1 D-alanine--D-alanine ligase [Anaerolineae bacterium]MBT7989268.1 D-alanine--D-alanine ligase [Anaerolineae bacterium]
MKIGFTYDLRRNHQPSQNSPADFYGEFETDETIDAITETITSLGHEVVKIGDLESLLPFLTAGNRVDLVFNMAEGRHGRARESQVPGVLEAYQIPYTFSDPLSLAICLDKGLTKDILRSANIPTPDYQIFYPDQPITLIQISQEAMPFFLKPLYEGTSKGIDKNAIVHTEETMRTRIRWLWAEYKQPVLLEKYLSGREFTVGVLGAGTETRIIGVAEISLKKEREVYGFFEKEACERFVSYDFFTEEPLYSELSMLAEKTWKILECRDGGRVDIRLDENGCPQVLEVNTLPGMHPTHSDLPIIAAHAGMTYAALLDEILGYAIKRMK